MTPDNEPPPFLGTWARVYGVILVLLVAYVALVTAFSWWRW